MRHLNLITLASSLLLAGAASQNGFNGLEPRFVSEDTAYRIECDNMMTVRPPDADYFDRMVKAKLPFAEAVANAEARMIDKFEYDDARTLRGELIILGNPFYRLEIFARKTTEEGEVLTHRWRVSMGMRGKIKDMFRQERLPGTPVRGDIITTDRGVMVHDVREGDGQEVREDSNVRVHFMVTRLDNAIIESTYEQREPLKFNMANPPIEGFKELIGSRAGGKRKLVIPPALAFGNAGDGNHVPPFTTLVYDIEILRVN